MKTTILTYALFTGLLLLAACKKGWLEEKRDIALTVPGTLKDFRALLNNDLLQRDNAGMAEVSADDYYLTPSVYQARGEGERNLHTWKPAIYAATSTATSEWNDAYTQIFYCNVALDGLEMVIPSAADQSSWNTLSGEALFYRSRAFYNLAQLFAPPYYAGTAASDMGIPLRLTADVNTPTIRSTVAETYRRIVVDLKKATALLPIQSSARTQPSKAAGYAHLARCLLAMRQYPDALLYADSALQLHPALLDFRSLNASLTYPVSPYNEEVVIQSNLFPLYSDFSPSYGYTDQAFYQSYAENDLRKKVFFRTNTDGSVGFRGSFTGSVQLFHGTTTGEMLLIRAECAARAGQYTTAMSDLNTLLEKRYDGTFVSLTVPDSEVLYLILTERRKELLRRGLRWSDLRRLNQEPERAVTLTRNLADEVFTLPPNDPRYVLPIPDYIIQTTDIAQNERD